MTPIVGILAVVAALAAAIWGLRHVRGRRRTRLRARSFSTEWDALLVRDVPLYRRLPVELRKELQGHVRVFLAEKRFEPCGGLDEVDERLRLIVAAQACVLLLGGVGEYFARLSSILIYPTAFVVPADPALDLDCEPVEDDVRVGESWELGSVVLARDEILRDLDENTDTNVVVHEFAHQLDQSDGASDGAPVLGSAADLRRWSEVLSREFEQLRRQVRRGHRTWIDDYATVSPAEFFAVVTEMFFLRPVQMQRRHPQLYEQFHRYYNVDPRSWDGLRTVGT